jgi:flagellar biosynthesis protein FliP
MLDSFFYWLGIEYQNELYVGGLKIAGILCSYADICVAAIMLRAADVIRERPPSKYRYGILLVFAIFTPTLLLPREGLDFFIVQFIILTPPYLILMHTAFTEAKFFMAYVKSKLASFHESC